MGFVVDRGAVGKAYYRILPLSFVSIIFPQIPRTQFIQPSAALFLAIRRIVNRTPKITVV